MGTNNSLIFDGDFDGSYERTHTVNRLAAGIVISENRPAISDTFRTQFRQYSQQAAVTTFDDDTALVDGFILAAVEQVESFINKSLFTRTVEDHFRLLSRSTLLSETPVQAVLKVVYQTGDQDGGSVVGDIPPEGTTANESFDVSPNGELRFSPFFVQWLNSNIYSVSRFVVRYVAGLGNTSYDTLPPQVRLAVLEVAAMMDWQRGAGDDKMARMTLISPKVETLLSRYRSIVVA